MDNSFSHSIHCIEAASKAGRMLFMIRRSFAELSVSAFAALYNTLVWPNLEFAMQACSPNLVADADCLEQIQQLATRLVNGFRRLPYEGQLRRLGLHSLGRRRLHGDLIVVDNIFFRRIGPLFYAAKVLQGPGWRLRRKSFFSTRVVKYWNRLPTPIVTAPSVNSFKCQLDSAWEELFGEVLFFTLSPFMLSQPLIHGHP